MNHLYLFNLNLNKIMLKKKKILININLKKKREKSQLFEILKKPTYSLFCRVYICLTKLRV